MERGKETPFLFPLLGRLAHHTGSPVTFEAWIFQVHPSLHLEELSVSRAKAEEHEQHN